MADTKIMPGTDIDANGFPENFVNRIFIDTQPTVSDNGDIDLTDVTNGKWAWLAGGINNVTPSSNETTTNDAYYDGHGFTETDVTGKQVQLAITGNRKIGDPAQDYVGGKFWKIGNSVKTRVIWISNGIPVIGKATLTNVVPNGGAANAKENFSFTIGFDGQPRIFNGQLKLALTSDPCIYQASVDSTQGTDVTDVDKQPKAIVIDNAPATPSTNPSGQPSGSGSNTDTGSGSKTGSGAGTGK